MTPYEAAMKRLTLEADMADALWRLWIAVEDGDHEWALSWQFEYLVLLDELAALPFSHEFYDMVYAAEYGIIK